MPIFISVILLYMIYENTFPELDKDILLSHNIVCLILLGFTFFNIVIRV